MFSLEILLKDIALVMIIGRYLYWVIGEYFADKYQPKTQSISLHSTGKRVVSVAVGLTIIFQLLGVDILPFSNFLVSQICGFILILGGIIVSILARKELGNNWAHAAEYQIKKDHQLITSGIYKYMRHPIYSGIILSYLGAELLVGSYLFFPLLGLIIMAYIQSKKEEDILVEEFGKSYKDYMKHSKMFLPLVW